MKKTTILVFAIYFIGLFVFTGQNPYVNSFVVWISTMLCILVAGWVEERSLERED